MSRSNRYRRLSVAPLAGVERRGRGTLGGGSLAVGIPDSLPLGSHFIQGSHPFAGVCSQYHQGQSSGGRGSGSPEQGGHRVGSASISRLLQLVVCGYESFRGVEAGHRPVHSELEGTADILQDGDNPIRSSLGLSGGLDGVSVLEGCVLAGANAPGFTQVPQVHGGGEGVPVHGTLSRPLHGSTSFYQGHGSCVSDFAQDGGTTSSLPGRLVASGFLPRAGSSCSEDSVPTLQTSRDCRQLGEVAVSSDSTDDLSGSPSGFHCFQGFACPEESREASLNWRCILVLRQAASVILAGVVRSAVLNDPTRSWGSSLHEVASTSASSSVGSGRSVSTGRMVSSDTRRSLLVARPRSISARRFSGAGVPSARVMVRRLGCGLGGSHRRSGRFRPLGSGGWRVLDQCSGALGDRESSPVVCSPSRRFLGGCLRRQFDCRVISEEPRRDSLFSSELHRSEDSPLGGGSVGCDFPAICSGETQCVGGRAFSPEPDLGRRVDAEAGGLHGSVQEVAGVNRPVCNITKSPMFTIFFSLPRSQCSGDGCTAPKLEWVAGVCLSSMVSHSSSVEEAPVVLWVATDHRSSVLASEAVVSGSSGSSGRRPSRSATVQRPSAAAPLPPIPSRGVQAVSSCLETIKRFTRAGGFSRRVAQQVCLARRPSSRAGYQSKWLVFRQWCRSEGHSVSRPSLPKIADFLFWLRRSRRLSISSIMGYRSMLYFKSVLPEISTSPVLHDLLRSFQAEALIREVHPPSWDLNVVVIFLRSSSFEPLTTISLRDLTRKTLFLLSLATAKRVGEIQALSRRVSFSSSSAGLSYVPEFVAKTESALQPIPRSFGVPSLGDFAAGMPEDLLLCPVRALSAYFDRTSSIVNRPRRLFVSPRCPSRAMSKNGISYMLRELIVHSGASSGSGQVSRAHSIRGIATSSAFFRN